MEIGMEAHLEQICLQQNMERVGWEVLRLLKYIRPEITRAVLQVLCPSDNVCHTALLS
jgi:hypothetical protein